MLISSPAMNAGDVITENDGVTIISHWSKQDSHDFLILLKKRDIVYANAKLDSLNNDQYVHSMKSSCTIKSSFKVFLLIVEYHNNFAADVITENDGVTIISHLSKQDSPDFLIL